MGIAPACASDAGKQDTNSETSKGFQTSPLARRELLQAATVVSADYRASPNPRTSSHSAAPCP